MNQSVFSWLQFRADAKAFSGKRLGFAGAAEEGYIDDGTPFGSVSGLMYRSLPWHAQARIVAPNPVFGIDGYDLKYRLIARPALAEKAITHMAAANPPTLLKLLSGTAQQRRAPQLGHKIAG